jgi:hypothetical protein
MTTASLNRKTWWRRALLPAAILAFAAAGTVPVLKAFKVGVNVTGWLPIHETITANAMLTVLPQADPMFVSNVQSGVFNTDFSHQPENAFHFDNSTATNGGFESGFAMLHGMLNVAQSQATTCDVNGQCTVNPLFLNPQHSSFRNLVEDIIGTYGDLTLNDGCLAEPACPTGDFAASVASVQVDVLPLLLDTDPDPDPVSAYTFQAPVGINCCSIPVPNFAETVAGVKTTLDSLLGQHCRPDWSTWPGSNPTCFGRLEDMAPDDNSFQLLAGHLRILQYEYQAYFAWQHLGHAFHTTQDFFAHSNYVELAAGHRGPPCTPDSFEAATICDDPLSSTAASGQLETTVPFGAIPLPTDGRFPWSLAEFGAEFSIMSVKSTLDADPKHQLFSDANSLHLQTGYFPCVPGAGSAPRDEGFPYCHTATPSIGSNAAAGMNKDERYANGGELNLQNHEWAKSSAIRMSAALFGAFMASLPNASTSGIAPSTATTAANPAEAIVWPVQLHLNTGAATLNAGNIAPVRSVRPPTPQLGTPRTPIQTAQRIVPSRAVLRILPSITRPELLQRNPQPHIFVKTFPNRAFRPGERVDLRVDAFDAKTGAQLHGLPVVIGNVRGVTSRPISLTVALTSTPHCGAVGGRQFCLNVLTPPSGTVIPGTNYPGGGGNFTLSVVIPKLLVGVAAAQAQQPGTATFTVSALDAHTRQPVPSAEVFVNGTPVSPANRPMTYQLNATARLQPRGRLGIETLPASFGPPLIVRAPGYSDEIVQYVLRNATSPVRR